MLVLEVIRKFSLQSLYFPDRKRILLDSSQPEKKHRWNEAHEIGHSLIPWHDDVMHGDNRHTLLPSCTEQVESEANFAAGRLLFLRDRFTEQALSMPTTLASIKSLHGDFGNSLSSTLWRFVETAGVERPMIGLISCHPHASRRPADFDPAKPCRHCIQSPAFAARFSQLQETDIFNTVASYCGSQSGGPLGARDLILTDDNGDEHVFAFETFFKKFKPPGVGEAQTLGAYLKPHVRIIAA